MRKKAVKMPSDYMTANQRKELNGMAVTYTMDQPHTYYELLAFPKDLRKEYMQGMLDKYHPSIYDLEKMLRVKRQTVMEFLQGLEITLQRYYRNPSEKFAWRVFMGENITPPEQEPVALTPIPEPENPVPKFSPIGRIDHLSIHVIGKPYAVANGIPAMLDTNKNYYFTINITEVNEKEEDTVACCVCGTGEAC